MEYKETAIMFKAFCDENRLQILELLRDGERCACRILDEMQITQPTLSHHMKILCECGLVFAFKEGKWQHYDINCERFKEFKESINAISCLNCEHKERN